MKRFIRLTALLLALVLTLSLLSAAAIAAALISVPIIPPRRRSMRCQAGRLFERTSRRVELTPIGRRLGDELRTAYQQIQDAIDWARAAGRGARSTVEAARIIRMPSGIMMMLAMTKMM